MAILIDSVEAKKEAQFMYDLVHEFVSMYTLAARNKTSTATVNIEIPTILTVAETIIPNSNL